MRDKHFVQVDHPTAGLAVRHSVQDKGIEVGRVVYDAVVRTPDVAVGPPPFFIEPSRLLVPPLVSDAFESILSHFTCRVLNPGVKKMFGAITIHPRDKPGRPAGKWDAWLCQEDNEVIANRGEIIVQPT